MKLSQSILVLLTAITVQGFAQESNPSSPQPSTGDITQIAQDEKLEVTLNGSELTTMAQVHEQIAKDLKFPSYYGKNLDALHDMLMNEDKDVTITILNGGELFMNIGEDKGQALLDLLNDVHEANSKVMAWFWQ
jgi:ribonuclease inhibitor